MQPAQRMSVIKPYFFSSLGKKIVKMREEGRDVIRLDMGSPDLPPADFIIDAMAKSARNSNTHGYTLGSGTQKFRKAVAEYYLTRFDVTVDPSSEVIDLIGSKEGLFFISQALLDPGDVALVPDPGYGVYASGARIAGAEVYKMPLLPENNFLPDLDAIPDDIAARAKILWLNYPNNPTGATATLEFLADAVAFGRKHNIIIAHDAPYADVGFDGYRAPSILQVPDAKDVTIEFNSFSKVYNMAGWRLGMALGNAEVLSYIETLKSQKDSAIFAPILDAGIAAMQGDQNWIEDRNGVYQERRDIVLEAFERAGLRAQAPKAALYVWAKIPEGEISVDFCARLLEETGISLTPGSVFGEYGEGYLRVSLVTPAETLKEGVERVVNWLS